VARRRVRTTGKVMMEGGVCSGALIPNLSKHLIFQLIFLIIRLAVVNLMWLYIIAMVDSISQILNTGIGLCTI